MSTVPEGTTVVEADVEPVADPLALVGVAVLLPTEVLPEEQKLLASVGG